MPGRSPWRHAFMRAVVLLAFAMLGGCAMVKVQTMDPSDYITQRRGDALTGNHLSTTTVETLRVAGVEPGTCEKQPFPCIDALKSVSPLSEERRQSALAEVWIDHADRLGGNKSAQSDEALSAYLESARHAYAYLFFTERTAGQRALEDRQTQVRDYYNYDIQQVTVGLAQRVSGRSDAGGDQSLRIEQWTVRADLSAVDWRGRQPETVLPASALRFKGLRSVYRRDGLGAELVADMGHEPSTHAPIADQSKPYSEMPSPSVTTLLRFAGADLEEVLGSRDVRLAAYDPYRTSDVAIAGQDVPLAANYTAGYGLWLARSGFATQSILTLLGRLQGIDKPHIYLMQPYDPNRHIIVMLHGLASSPEAWINVANEVLGDERLRQNYQIWQVYYPTNMPIAANNDAIRQALKTTLDAFDPSRSAVASHNMVIIGHSMGGVIARLMVSSSGSTLWDALTKGDAERAARISRVASRLRPFLVFDPFPGFSEAIFIAAPHRGTAFAANRIGRWVANLVKLPAAALDRFSDVANAIGQQGTSDKGNGSRLIPNSIDNLDASDPFIIAASDLTISSQVGYHSIIARRSATGPLEDSDAIEFSGINVQEQTLSFDVIETLSPALHLGHRVVLRFGYLDPITVMTSFTWRRNPLDNR